MEVDAEQLDIHRARLVALVVVPAVVAAVGLGWRGADEQRGGDGEEEGVLHPHGGHAVNYVALFSRCPPKPKRIADRARLPNSPSPRDSKRV